MCIRDRDILFLLKRDRPLDITPDWTQTGRTEEGFTAVSYTHLDVYKRQLSTAALKICEMHGMGGQSIQYAPLSMIETLQEAAVQQMQTEAKAARCV